MFKPKGLLKVISVIMIVFGVLGGAMTIFAYTFLPQLADTAGVDTSLLEGVYTPLTVVISIISTLCCILAGIFGISGKSMRWAMIFGGVYTLIVLYNIITSIVSSGFQFTFIISFIIPILYWWGIYQSREA